MSKSIEKHVAGQVKLLIKELNIAEDKIQSIFEEVSKDLKSLKEHKQKGGNFEDVKTNLKVTTEKDYLGKLVLEHTKGLIIRTRELLTLAGLFNIDLNLNEKEQELHSIITSYGKPLFALEKGSLVEVKNDVVEKVKEAFNTGITDTALFNTYSDL